MLKINLGFNFEYASGLNALETCRRLGLSEVTNFYPNYYKKAVFSLEIDETFVLKYLDKFNDWWTEYVDYHDLEAGDVILTNSRTIEFSPNLPPQRFKQLFLLANFRRQTKIGQKNSTIFPMFLAIYLQLKHGWKYWEKV